MKKLKMVLFVGVVMMFLSTTVKAQGIEFFHGTYAEAQAKAKKEGKQLFMDFYTSWCGPCKVMAKKYFTLESVGKVYNKKFICLKIDAEKGEGPEIAKKYGVKVYPTLVFADSSGKEVKTIKGMQNEQQLLELAK
ncbi:thioredoxin family protein [Marinifilum caeruleilacunae]|jgi:thiol-disulfide isomerase/thioredoxin|uniref:Thioredoxin n=1 Tax=Marinifilum caeruleilacunae TaxID=2499076 RepID=A0ABX1WTA3_9BACT|nr:thioredoxin family protein [Marinifilum caeruleilacunae]NOU59335.1 thioredoxin [Marinifilum caeruleilacunae]